MDLLQEYIHKSVKQMNEDIEKAVVEFLKKEGYELNEVSTQAVAALQEQLAAEGKRLKVEIFTKMSGNLTATMVVIPYFEPLDVAIQRAEIYKMFRLASQGYQI